MHANTATPTPQATPGTLGGKYLTFRMGEEEFGLEIMKVQEILGLLPVTHMPRLPAYVRGVVNLRGRIVPTIDLRAKFGMPARADSPRTCIVVIEVPTAGRPLSVGLIVDEVAEVVQIASAETSSVAQFAGAIPMEYVLGVGIVNDSVKVLLDAERVTTFEDVRALESAVRSAAAHN